MCAYVCIFAGTVKTYSRTDSSADFFETTGYILAPPGTGAGEQFGAAVSLGSSTALLVGAPVTGTGGAGGTSGRAYKYTWNFVSSTWDYQTHYVPSNSTTDSNWGVAVAMGSNDICVVGSTTENSGAGLTQPSLFFLVHVMWILVLVHMDTSLNLLS